MLKNYIDKMKDNLSESKKHKNKTDKKKIESLGVLILLIVIVVIIINNMWKEEDTGTKDKHTNSNKQLVQVNADYSNQVDVTVLNTQEQLKNSLEDILSQISGVGNVKVLITYSESSQIIPMYNENLKQNKTEEIDSGGGSRKVDESDSSKNIIYDENVGKPITQKVISPKIEGVIVSAEGANSLDVKSNIIQAVEAVTGVATYKIQVFEKNNQQ